MKKGFTLIELLVVISIIGVLIAISVVGLQGARKSSRDAVRKADLEEIRSGLEMYKADCGGYPTGINFSESIELSGSDSELETCKDSNVYISSSPTDPVPGRYYSYSSNGLTYTICASLEQGSSGSVENCGNCGETCNYMVTNP